MIKSIDMSAVLLISLLTTCNLSHSAERKKPEPPQEKTSFVTARYDCVRKNRNRIPWGTCVIYEYAQSCAAAFHLLDKKITEIGDVCTNCNGHYDENRVFGETVKYIQGGPCQGFHPQE